MRGTSTPQCNNFWSGVSLQNRDEGITDFTNYPYGIFESYSEMKCLLLQKHCFP